MTSIEKFLSISEKRRTKTQFLTKSLVPRWDKTKTRQNAERWYFYNTSARIVFPHRYAPVSTQHSFSGVSWHFSSCNAICASRTTPFAFALMLLACCGCASRQLRWKPAICHRFFSSSLVKNFRLFFASL